MTEMSEKARIIIDTAYGLCEESDEIIRITENGLIKAISFALSQASREGYKRGRKENFKREQKLKKRLQLYGEKVKELRYGRMQAR